MQRRKKSDKQDEQRPSGGSPQRPSGGSPQRPSGGSAPSSSKDPKAPLPQSTLRQEMTASPPSAAGPSQRPSTPPTRRSSGSDDLYNTSQPSSQHASPVPSRVNSPVPQGGQARGRSVPPEASSNPHAGSQARGYSAPPEASSNPQAGGQAQGRNATPEASSNPQADSLIRPDSPNLTAAMRCSRLAGEPVKPNVWYEAGPVQYPGVPQGIEREQWKARYEKTYKDGDFKAVEKVMYDMRWGYLEPTESELPNKLRQKAEQLERLRACEARAKQRSILSATQEAKAGAFQALEELKLTDAWLKSTAVGRARTWLDANNWLIGLVKDEELFGLGPLGRLTMYTDRIDLLIRVASNQLAPDKYEEKMKYLWRKHQMYALDCINNRPPSLWTLW